MPRHRLLAVALAAWLLPLAAADQKKEEPRTSLFDLTSDSSYKSLAPAYQNWLDMVAYIASRDEKRVFLNLGSDRDRDAFIAIFWQQRDPTPGTPQNEARDEAEKRFAYANDVLRRGSSRPGWMTDMGRFYMILGKPSSIDRYDDKAGLYPVQVWWYYGDKELGLPTYFGVTFFKPHGAGEWKLYNSSTDGPGALLVQTGPTDATDFSGLLKKINELAPALVGPARSMIPNDQNDSVNGPSMRNNFILAAIYDSPTRRINAAYATNFLKYKGFVNIDQSINFIESSHLVSLFRDPRFDYDFVTVSLRPRKISVAYNEDKDRYYFNFNLHVNLRRGETVIYQYAKNFDFSIRPDEVEALQSTGVVIHDTFPVIPGRYELMVYADNAVGKEFTYFDKVVNAPGDNGVPFVAAPLLGFRRDPVSDSFFASYKFPDGKLCIDPERTFAMSEVPVLLAGAYNLNADLWPDGRLEVLLKGLSERNPYCRSRVLKLADFPPGQTVSRLLPLADAPLRPDYYEVTLRLLNGAGALLDAKSETFTVSPLVKLNHPMEAFKRATVEAPFYFDQALAAQYEGIGEPGKAEACYERSLRKNDAAMDVWLAFLGLENRLHKYNRVLADAERLKGVERLRFDYHRLRGTALYGLGKWADAESELLQANKIYNADTRVLNLLGFTWLKRNDPEQALQAFAASLQLNREQPLIAQAVETIRRRDGAAQKK